VILDARLWHSQRHRTHTIIGHIVQHDFTRFSSDPDRASRYNSIRRSSVDARGRELEDRKPPILLSLSPQLERAAQQLTTFSLAILFDQLLDARQLCRTVGLWKNHSISVWERSTPRCPLLDSEERWHASYSCHVGGERSLALPRCRFVGAACR